MNTLLFAAVFAVLSVVYYMVGMYAAQSVQTDNDYFLAGRNLGFWSLTGTLLATQLGGGAILGTAAHAYSIGWYGIFYSLGIAIGFLVLGLGFAGALRSFNIATTAELFEQQFGSVRLKQIASLLSILSLAGLFLGQVVASKGLMVGMGVHSEWLFIGFWVLLIGYTMYGGLPAVVATDILQVLIIVTVFVGLFASLWWQGIVDLSIVRTPLGQGVGTDFLKEYWFAYIGMPLMFSLVEQDLAQRFFAARSKVIAMSSALVASVLVLLFAAIPVYLGMQAKLSGVVLTGQENPLLVFLGQQISPFAYVLVMCALIAAVASTADSLLCAISSNLVQDFMSDASSAARMWSARVATVAVGVAGIIGAYYCADILQVLTESYQLLVSSILVAVLVCFTSLPRIPRAATLSVAAGFSSYVLLATGMVFAPYGIPRAIAALLCAVLGYAVGMITWTKEQ